jgi:hypothetical protein
MGKGFGDVFDWVKRLQMATKVCEYDEEKFLKIAKFNLQGKAKDWYMRLNPMPLDWETLWILMLAKYGVYDGKKLKVKMDVIKQEPVQRVQNYYDRLEHLFVKGRILNVKRRRWSLAHLRLKIRKLCVVRTYVDMDELLASTIEFNKVLGHY